MQCLLEKILGKKFCYGGTGMDVAFPGPNQGLVTKKSRIRCFICQRITKDNYSGWKKALDGCGVWFHKKDSSSPWCWCPQCQIELQEPDEAE